MDLNDMDEVEKLLMGPSGFSSLSIAGGDDEERSGIVLDRLKDLQTNAKDMRTASKSIVMLDIKPACGDTDLSQMEQTVRQLTCEGLVWGPSKLVPIAYGIQKLRIITIVADSVPVEELIEQICAFEDFIQSVDVVAFCAL